MKLHKKLAEKLQAIAMCGLLVTTISLSGCGKKPPASEGSPHYRRAVQAYDRGDFQKAVSLFMKAHSIDPSNTDIYVDIAAIYDDFLGNPSMALSFYEKYLENPTSEEKAAWVRRWAANARKRAAAKPAVEGQVPPGPETVTESDQYIQSLQDQIRSANQLLVEEKEKTRNLSERIAALNARLSAAEKERQELRHQMAADSRAGSELPDRGKDDADSARSQVTPAWHRQWVTVGWLLSACLAFLVVALIIRQRYARMADRALVASIQASAAGENEAVQKDDILGKYFWVENDHSAGLLSFTEKDDEIHVCAIDGTTRLRSRGKGQLVGNVLTAELSSPGEEGVMTKFIFANKGRTLTAVWQGDQGTAVAAGTKEVQD